MLVKQVLVVLLMMLQMVCSHGQVNVDLAVAVKVDLVKTGQLLMNSKMDIVVLFVTML